MKRIIKDYFSFSKKERTAVVILLLLTACFIAAPYFYSVKPKPPVINKALAEFLAKQKASPSGDSIADDHASPIFRESYETEKNIAKENFPFDPNTVSIEEWKRLGISEKTTRTIMNYRNKGGKFRSPADIWKIWGIKKEDAERLIPFVRIETNDTYQSDKKKYINLNPQPVTRNKINPVNINTATPEEWKALPGIGEVLANRIIKFRERIGGFTSIEQVHKTYGISDSVFQVISPYLILNEPSIQKINLNTASAYDLKIKTNIPDAVAKAIIVYRQQYGPYQSVNDLRKIILITDSLFQRIAPICKID